MRLLLLPLLFAACLVAHDKKGKAHAPASAKSLKNPLPATEAAAGKDDYQALCAGCHSAKGKGPDLTSHHMHMLKDGEIFWVITNGIGKTMPAFKSQLSDADRWRIVLYVRQLSR